MKNIVTILTIVLTCISLPTKATKACQTSEYRAFDFWLGKWQVSSNTDNIIRHNHISKINNGCTLLEEYSSPSGYRGKSLNIYDRQTRGC